MKKAIILLLLSVSANFYSQDYIPLLDLKTIWTVGYNDYNALPPESWQVQYQYREDILIDGIIYKDYGNNAILREDTLNRKVYMRDNSLINNECLLYDFNVKQGDKIDVCDFQITIDSISTIIINNGQERKIFYYQGTITGEYYIEGIGSNEGFIEISEAIGPPGIDLMCVEKEGVELYGKRCDEVNSISNNLKNNININIYPNPTNSILEFESDIQIKSFRILDITSKCILNDILADNIIELKNFKTGFYIIEFYDEKKYILDRKEFIFN